MAEELTPEMKEYDRWKHEIDAAVKRQKDWWSDGTKIDLRFKDDRGGAQGMELNLTGENPFRLNLYNANVNTTMAMLYGRVPKADVSRRYADPDDDVSRVAAEILERQLNLQMVGGNDPQVLRHCLQDFLIPGFGSARVKYNFTTRKVQQTVQQQGPDGEITTGTEETTELAAEQAKVVYTHWRDQKWGYGRTWEDVPWTSFTLYMTKQEVIARFDNEKEGKKYSDKLEYNKQPIGHESDDQTESHTDKPWLMAEIEEIWDKATRKVIWWSKDCEEILDKRDDPLGLDNFFPCPRPMAANCTTSLFLPRSDFKIAQDLYNQIDVLQTRIGIITKAVKVIGVYDQAADGIKRMFNEGVENELIPVDNWAMFAEKGGLKGQIDWLPVTDIVEALTKLEQLRDTHIALLYQITGMSDILRGHSEQYAGVGQEELKARFASIRIQYLEDEFARFASDLANLRVEVVRKHFDPDSIIVQSNAKFMQELPQLIEAAVMFIKQNPHFPWQVEIKAESLAMIDYAKLQSERTEFITSTATLMQSAAPILELHPGATPFILEILKWGMAGFKGSQQIEGVVDKIIQDLNKNPPQQQQEPDPSAGKIAEIQAKAAAEREKEQLQHHNNIREILITSKTKLMEIAAETESDLSVEQAQAFFNILEKEVESELDAEVKQLEADLRPEKETASA